MYRTYAAPMQAGFETLKKHPSKNPAVRYTSIIMEKCVSPNVD